MTGLATYVGMLHRAEQTLIDSFAAIGSAHAADADLPATFATLSDLSREHLRLLGPIADRYGELASGEDIEEPERLHADGLAEGRAGPVGLLRDLQDLYVLAALLQTTWTVVQQAAQGARDRELIDAAESATADVGRQLAWLTTRIKAAAPQALLVAR